jgi:AraC-like DNA-binding protein
VVLLALPSGNRMANRYLALFLAAEAVRLAGYTLLFSDIIVPLAFYFAPGFGVFAAPLLYLYVRALVDPNLQLGRVGWRVFAPLLPLYLTAVAVGLQSETPVKFTGYGAANQGPWAWFGLAYHLLFIGYAVAALRALASHRGRIESMFSSVNQLDLRWLRLVLLVALASWAGFWLVDLLRVSRVLELSSRVYVNELSSLLIIYLISIGGMRQPEIFTVDVRKLYAEVIGRGPTPLQPEPAAPYRSTPASEESSALRKAGLDVESAAALWSSLGEKMREHKAFLNNQLTLKDVAAQLQISPQVLSLVLNRHANMSFYDYINALRVAHATELLRSPKKAKRNLLEIAEEAGFNSQATFYKHFKKIQGVTPKQYRQRASASN